MSSSNQTFATDVASDSEIQLTEYIAVLLDHWKLITATVTTALLLGALYVLIATPLYRADALIQVEDEPNPANEALGQLASMFSTKQVAVAEMALIGSRLVVGNTVDVLHLDIDARPRYVPLFGHVIVQRADDGVLSPPLLGMSRFAWGGEKILVSRFDVAKANYDEKYTLVADRDGAYDLLSPNGTRVLRGRLGVPATGRDASGPISLVVDELTARPGTEFILRRRSTLDTIGELQQKLVITEMAKESGIISVSLDGEDSARTAQVINTIAAAYLQQNIDRKSAEAEKTLKFLDDALPQLREQLEKAESRYNAFRRTNGTIDLTQEGQLLLQQIVDTKTKLVELQQRRMELAQRFVPSHPDVMAIDAQIAGLNASLERLNRRVTALPDAEQTAVQLTRDVRVDTELYTNLLNSTQQLKIVKAGQVGSVRIVDYAVAQDLPVKPKKSLVLILAVLSGFFVGTAIALGRRMLLGGVKDSEELERTLGLPVYAMVPHSEAQVRIRQRMHRGDPGAHLLALSQPGDLAIEALRSLRTALQFGQMGAANNVVAITSPRPEVGKSFTSANLAVVLATGGKRVLLIDADMRRGSIHLYFGLSREVGLSDVVAGNVDPSAAIVRAVIPNVDVLPKGSVSTNPAELLLSDRMKVLLDKWSSEYDVVVVDTPPVLAVTDAAVVAKYAGATLLAIKHGDHPMPEIVEVTRRLRTAGVSLKGALFTHVAQHSINSGSYYASYYSYTNTPN
ncbi:polysaccharide biosynthesis tyrosine autokinase [Paraburkholderia terrae]|uniref:polysaccharide biosynthesis tyrosine autokinase n=1 Tax=Paraburkholderia terrae TaxID=311230 RepID=UPI00296B1EDC|nr:polysaccharide biosynthesis tyrosine autokinase [Paraburkholderia terrae]MDW3655378.1 polysaccharide biosynthesis tyrosine autokinase [Paraburkholderia terrae]